MMENLDKTLQDIPCGRQHHWWQTATSNAVVSSWSRHPRPPTIYLTHFPGADPGFREGGFLLLGRAKRRNFWVDHAPVYMPRPLINHIPLAWGYYAPNFTILQFPSYSLLFSVIQPIILIKNLLFFIKITIKIIFCNTSEVSTYNNIHIVLKSIALSCWSPNEVPWVDPASICLYLGGWNWNHSGFSRFSVCCVGIGTTGCTNLLILFRFHIKY